MSSDQSLCGALHSVEQIADIRASSRLLVRELGVLDKVAAETELSLSAVHAILEIGNRELFNARDLGECLRLEKSTISRLVQSLLKQGLMERQASKQDARERILFLTPSGQKLFHKINYHANSRVSAALMTLSGDASSTVASGLSLYSQALQNSRLGKTSSRDSSVPVQIKSGYKPGIAGQITDLHARFYHKHSGFDLQFEATVGSGLADFLPRLRYPANQIWHIDYNGRLAGSIALDGEDLGDNIGHLRWFIMDDALRGTGLGKMLFQTALAFADKQQFDALHLWTFQGLDAARHLYESHGFELAEEYLGDQWGKNVMEQKFVRPTPEKLA
ncbi:MAG TPA: MarR family transcriptional regulator [Rhizobiales bacterium]|nr:MarR family transcriptional regulator [Hyphomicrobiales bacterium]